jgi:hypothetical protein
MDFDNISNLFEKMVVYGVVVASLIYGIFYTDNRHDFFIALSVGIVASIAIWAKFKYWSQWFH